MILPSPSLNIRLGVVDPVVASIAADQKLGASLLISSKVWEVVGGVGPPVVNELAFRGADRFF